MITINAISEIEKYKWKERKSKDETTNKVVYYKFKENGCLADVTINDYIPFTVYDLGLLIDEIVDFSKVNNCVFIAKNIYLKNRFGGGLYKIIAKNLYFRGHLEVQNLKVSKSIVGGTLFVFNVKANNIDCEKFIICANDVNCNHIKAKELNLSDYKFENVNADMRTIRKLLRLPF